MEQVGARRQRTERGFASSSEVDRKQVVKLLRSTATTQYLSFANLGRIRVICGANPCRLLGGQRFPVRRDIALGADSPGNVAGGFCCP
jgi:hypothetical protein